MAKETAEKLSDQDVMDGGLRTIVLAGKTFDFPMPSITRKRKLTREMVRLERAFKKAKGIDKKLDAQDDMLDWVFGWTQELTEAKEELLDSATEAELFEAFTVAQEVLAGDPLARIRKAKEFQRKMTRMNGAAS